jgi:hypothetical protein
MGIKARKMEGFAKSIARTLMSEFATELLGRVAVDYGLDHKTLLSKYLNFETVEPVKKAAAPKAAASGASTSKTLCSVITAKGTQCKFPAVEGTCKCKKHTAGGEPKEVETCGACTGKTASGAACKFTAKPGCGGMCGTHFRKSGGEAPEPKKKEKVQEPEKTPEPEEPKKKVSKKKKKVVEPEEVMVTVEDLLGTEEKEDITTRLRNILAECSDEEETVRELVSSEDEEEYENEDNVLGQMCGSPISREKLLAMLEEEEEEEN